MSFIAEVAFESPLFRPALAAAPEVRLQFEDIRTPSGQPQRFLFWARGDALQRFEDALAGDPTVGSFQRLDDSGPERLYRVALSRGTEDSLYSVVVEHDVLLLELEVTVEGKRALGRVPDREALVAFRDACDERGFDFRLERLYREAETAGDGGIDLQYGVTAAQREALSTALEMGYFEVPREASLEAVAEALGISRQALSARLRRAQTNLVRSTVG